jgi:hypothetical protein
MTIHENTTGITSHGSKYPCFGKQRFRKMDKPDAVFGKISVFSGVVQNTAIPDSANANQTDRVRVSRIPIPAKRRAKKAA